MNKLMDTVLGIHPRAMEVGAQRLELIAGNIANADTPGFKARDIDFRATLQALLRDTATDSVALGKTHPLHQAPGGAASFADPLYRVPNLPSLDGNSVDMQLEQAAFNEASIRYQASVDFLDQRFQGMRKVLRGE